MREVSVVYLDGMMAMVDPKILQGLIDRGKLIKFQRSGGWVYPKIDQIRSSVHSDYQGQERRFL